MTRETESPGPVDAVSLPEEKPLLQRQPSRRNMTLARSRLPRNLRPQYQALNDDEHINPFSAGFEFAKKAPAPAPVSRASRRSSLTTTTYAFEVKAQQLPRLRQTTLRPSMGHADSSSADYAQGLRAFGARQHHVQHVLRPYLSEIKGRDYANGLRAFETKQHQVREAKPPYLSEIKELPLRD